MTDAKLVIATTTMYEDKEEVRAQLAAKTIQEAEKQGHPIVIVDESSDESTRSHFRNLGAVVFSVEKPGMGNSRRQVIREAANLAGPDGIVAWLEPEKNDFVRSLGTIRNAMVSESADLVMPRRKSLESYPLLQQRFEILGNLAFKMLTGRGFDSWFGPRIFKSELASFFLEYGGEYGDQWDSIQIPPLRIIKTGKKAIEVEVDFTYPEEQKAEEEERFPMFRKRMEQLLNCVGAFEKECGRLGLP